MKHILAALASANAALKIRKPKKKILMKRKKKQRVNKKDARRVVKGKIYLYKSLNSNSSMFYSKIHPGFRYYYWASRMPETYLSYGKECIALIEYIRIYNKNAINLTLDGALEEEHEYINDEIKECIDTANYNTLSLIYCLGRMNKWKMARRLFMSLIPGD